MPSVTLYLASLGPGKHGERKLHDHYHLNTTTGFFTDKKFPVYKFVMDIFLSEDVTSSHISSS